MKCFDHPLPPVIIEQDMKGLMIGLGSLVIVLGIALLFTLVLYCRTKKECRRMNVSLE